MFLSRGEHGNALQSESARIGALLGQSPDRFQELGDLFPLGQVIPPTGQVQIRSDFGAGFFESLQSLKTGVWSGPVLSSLGLHWVRITARGEFQPAQLADVRQQVLTDYQTAQHERLMRQAIDRLKLKYRVDVEEMTP